MQRFWVPQNSHTEEGLHRTRHETMTGMSSTRTVGWKQVVREQRETCSRRARAAQSPARRTARPAARPRTPPAGAAPPSAPPRARLCVVGYTFIRLPMRARLPLPCTAVRPSTCPASPATSYTQGIMQQLVVIGGVGCAQHVLLTPAHEAAGDKMSAHGHNLPCAHPACTGHDLPSLRATATLSCKVK